MNSAAPPPVGSPRPAVHPGWAAALSLPLLVGLTSHLALPSALEPRLWPVVAVAAWILLQYGWRHLPALLPGTLLAAGSLLSDPATPTDWTRYPLVLLVGGGAFLLTPVVFRALLQVLPQGKRPDRPSLTALSLASALGAMVGSLFWCSGEALLRGQAPDIDTLLFRFFALGLPVILLLPLMKPFRTQRRPLTAEHWKTFAIWLLIALPTFIIIARAHSAFLFLTLPLFIWAAVRLEGFHANLLNALTILGLLTLLPLGQPDYPAADLTLQAQLALFFLCGLYLNAAIAEHREAEARLEDRVLQRTQDLQQINQELQDEVFIRKQAEKSLLSSSRRYRSLIETAGSPIVILDRQHRIRQWNRAAALLLGPARDDLQGRDFLKTFLPHGYEDESAWKIGKVFETGQPLENLETEVVDASGRQQVMLWNVSYVGFQDDEQDAQVIVIGQNITSIRETQNQLHYLAHYDVLTGAANRRLFEDRCRQALRQAARHGHDVGLIGLDVDHFKRINDTLGHDTGDELLKVLFGRMRDCVRSEDTIGRLGGDEFAILLNKVNGAEGCTKVAGNLLKAITRPVQLPGKQLVITTSIGVTLSPRDGSDYSVLLKNADMAMYRAKKNGRNNIQFYEPEMGAEAAHQLNIEQDLRQALEKGQFVLYYQPQVDLEDNRVIGFEALLRWHHPMKGLLTPSYFLDVADQSGLLPTLGIWVIDQVAQQSRQLAALGGDALQLSINLSARELRHPGLLNHIRDALMRSEADAHLLNFEISEQSIVSNIEESTRTLHALKALGCSLTIDSFGSGLSSLSHLASLPIDALKTHHALVHQVPGDGYDTAIFNTLVAIAQGMDIRLIVEGVETETQEHYMRGRGIRFVQGLRFSPPIAADALPGFFDRLKHGELSRDQEQLGLLL